MFERVELRVSDLATSQRFYATVLAALPLAPGPDGAAWADFALMQADAAHPPTRGLHVGFAAPSRAAVDAFWEAGTRAGYRDDGPPGPRPQYIADYYGAFLLDPDGNSAEAVHYDDVRSDGAVDHLWIRVADLAASRRWYEALAQRAGLEVEDGRSPSRFHVRLSRAHRGSFALVADDRPATKGARIALTAPNAPGPHVDPDGNEVTLVQHART